MYSYGTKNLDHQIRANLSNLKLVKFNACQTFPLYGSPNCPLPAMRGHGEIFPVKCLRNLGLRLVQPSMGMAIEAKIAR